MNTKAMFILALLEAAGHTAVLAGGCVRDGLAGKAPKDYDIATSASGEEVVAILGSRCKVIDDLGSQFGVTVVIHEGEQFEIAAFRTEGDYDGRRPRFTARGTMEQDALRRDFTVNAMFQLADGTVLDFVGGRADLASRTLRCVGDANARIGEDKLRMLRAVRFAAQGFQMAPCLFQAIQDNAHEIGCVSADRVRGELLRILGSGNPRLGLELLRDTGLLKHVLPELSACIGCEQDCIHHPEGDVFEHTLVVVDLLKNQPDWVIFTGMLHDVGKCIARQLVIKDGVQRITNIGHAEMGADMADIICRRLNFSNADREKIVLLVDQHMRLHKIGDMSKGKAIGFVRRLREAGVLDAAVELQSADSMGNVSKDRRSVFMELIEQSAPALVAKPFVTGADLIAAGHKPGPLFKSILADLRERQDAGEFSSRDEALLSIPSVN